MKPYIQLSESTLYTILKRLETANMLTVRTAEHGGRLRKYYHITDVGLKRIEDFKDEWKWPIKTSKMSTLPGVYRLKADNPDKHFYFPAPCPCCRDMKLNSLENVLTCLMNETNTVEISEDVRRKALIPLDRMLELAK